jgi:hypothetical protein
MTRHATPCETCHEISAEVMDMAGWLSGGDLSPEQFRLALARMEHRKLKRFGLAMTTSTSGAGMVHVTLRFEETGEFCASMDIDPITGDTTIQRACH